MRARGPESPRSKAGSARRKSRSPTRQHADGQPQIPGARGGLAPANRRRASPAGEAARHHSDGQPQISWGRAGAKPLRIGGGLSPPETPFAFTAMVKPASEMPHPRPAFRHAPSVAPHPTIPPFHPCSHSSPLPLPLPLPGGPWGAASAPHAFSHPRVVASALSVSLSQPGAWNLRLDSSRKSRSVSARASRAASKNLVRSVP
jgi:hypothetical protein